MVLLRHTHTYLSNHLTKRRKAMKRMYYITVLVGFLFLLVAGTQSIVQAGDKDKDKDHGRRDLRTHLIGYEEVPAVSSTGSGVFHAKVSEDGTSFNYEISYEGLEGNVTQSHIHFG